MALHEVQLKGYSVRPGNLSLGTFGSYGIEQLHVTLDDTWSGLAGANTVLTDADRATVTGRADPIKRITDLEDAVASQT